MNLEKSLYQKSYVYFIGFFLLMLVGFWFTYFTRISEQENYRMHTHGAALVLWCVMLVVQPYLISIKKYALHRQLGTASYVLMPIFVYTTLDLLHYRLPDVMTTMDFFSVALVLNAVIAVAIFYVLAIIYRKKPTVHARYMVCTLFPMITPVTDRIHHIYFPSTIGWLPTIEGNPVVPVVGFALADLLLVILCIWDWRAHQRWNVFPVALAILLFYHYSVLNFYKFPFWQTFSNWFASS
jgi:hypothetical protein